MLLLCSGVCTILYQLLDLTVHHRDVCIAMVGFPVRQLVQVVKFTTDLRVCHQSLFRVVPRQ